jgi:sec-independent protein translocase protein TatC
MKPKTKPTKNRLLKRRKPRPEPTADTSLPFIEHLHELRRRAIYIALSVVFFSTLAYFVQQHIVNFLLKPSAGQQFIYTSPGGGINFLFTVCLYVGIALSMPIIVYQVLGFFAPLIRDNTKRSMIRYAFFSGALAVAGFCQAYFVGLPRALHFLQHQFTTRQVHALFTVQEYMNFLLVYLLGAVLLFQLPIIISFINRIRPLPPRKLLGAERYVVVAAIIIGMIMAPTPDILNQAIIVVPVILMYNLSILLVWQANRRRERPANIVELLERDQQVQAGRLQKPKQPLPVTPLADGHRHGRRPRRLAVNYLSAGPTAVNVRLA